MAKKHYFRRDWQSIAFHKDIGEVIRNQILDSFENGMIKTEMLKTTGDLPIYAIKTSKSGRLICTSKKVKYRGSESEGNCLIALHYDPTHKFDFTEEKIVRKLEFNKADFPSEHTKKFEEVISGIATNDTFIFYSKEQNKVAQSVESIDPNSHDFLSQGIKYYIVNGLAGSGKTTMAYDVLSTASMKGIKSVYLSKSEKLVKVAKDTLSTEESDSDSSSSDSEAEDMNEFTPTEFITYNNFATNQFDQLSKKKAGIKEADIQNFKKFRSAQYKDHEDLENVSSEDLYSELQKLAPGKTAHKFLHSAPRNGNSLAKEIRSKYVEFLKENNFFDPRFIATEESGEKTEEEALHTIVVIDETQNFTQGEIKSILQHYPNSTFYLCRDGNQSLSDPYDTVMDTMFKETGNKPTQIFDLNISYRTPPAVTELANAILDAKAKIVGGKLNSVDATQSTQSQDDNSDTFESVVDHQGYVRILDNIESDEFDKLKKASENFIETVIIVFNEEAKAQAIKDFGLKAMILLPIEAVGLEYKKVVLYKPFDARSSLPDDKIFNEIKYKRSEEAPQHRPKTDANIKYVVPFNELFVGATRTTSDLYIFNDGKVKNHKKLNELFESILKEHSGQAASEVSKMTLESLISYIDEKKDSYSDGLLLKYLTRAVSMLSESDIKQTEAAATELLQILNNSGLPDSQQKDQLQRQIDTVLPKKKDPLQRKKDSVLTNKMPEKAANQTTEKTEEVIDTTTAKQKNKSGSPKGNAKKNKTNLKEKNALPAKTELAKKNTNTPNAKKFELTQMQKNKLRDSVSSPNSYKAFQTDLKGIRKKHNSPNLDFDVHGETILHIAVQNNNTKAIKDLVDAGANVNLPNQDGITALMIAAGDGHIDIVKILANCEGIDLNQANKHGDTAFIAAASEGRLEVVKYLANCKGINLNYYDKKGNTALIWAVLNGHQNIVEYLVSCKNIDPNHANIVEMTALKLAISNKSNVIVKLLVECDNIDLNHVDKEGRTALTYAECTKDHEIIELLKGDTLLITAAIEGKIEGVKHLVPKCTKEELNAKNNQGHTALMAAAVRGHTEIIKLLANCDGIKLNLQDKDGNTALMIAAGYGHKEIVEFLATCDGIDLNLQDNNGNTVLIYALIKGHHEIVKYLANCDGINLNLQDKDGNTALTFAATKGHKEIVEHLANKDTINHQDGVGITVLMIAAGYGHKEIVEFLATCDGIKRNLQDKDGNTALIYAASQGHLEVVKYLANCDDIKLNLQDKDGNTALMMAAKYGHTEIAEHLTTHYETDINYDDQSTMNSCQNISVAGGLPIIEEGDLGG